jgi:hypothetical protein
VGHSISGFAFGAPPDARKLQAELPQLALVLAKHKRSQLWFLSARLANSDEPEYPFSDLMYLGDSHVGFEEHEIAETLDQCVVATDNGYADGLVAPAVRLALALNRILDVQTLYFAANDDGVNLALLVDDGRVSAFHSSADYGSVEMSERGIVVKPEFTYLEEDDKEDATEIEEQFEPLRSLASVTVTPLKVVPDGEGESRSLHDSTLKVWPGDWPDPGSSAGIGTWDSFGGYPGEFEIVYSRP